MAVFSRQIIRCLTRQGVITHIQTELKGKDEPKEKEVNKKKPFHIKIHSSDTKRKKMLSYQHGFFLFLLSGTQEIVHRLKEGK